MARPLFLSFVVVLCACGSKEGRITLVELQGMRLAQPQVGHPLDPLAFDVEQHNCALYVALRSHALESSISFGRDLAQVDVHWNMCPGGTMVACATAPGPNGSEVVTGIPWPYGTAVRH